MPGPAYTYALAFAMLGKKDISVKLLLMPWIAFTAWLIFKLGVRLKDESTGLFAAIIFIILTAQFKMKGTTAELELFANLPIVWGISLAIQFSEQSDRISSLFWAGLMFGFVLIYKASLILFIIPVGVMLFILFWQEVRTSKEWQNSLVDLLKRCVVLVIGLLIIVLPILGYFAWQGVLDRFLLIFSLGQGYLSYSSSLPAYRILLIPVIILAYNNAALLVIGLAGLLRLCKTWRRWNSNSITLAAILTTWLLISFLITGITRVGYVHYALVVIPPLGLVAAWEISFISEHISNRLKLVGSRKFYPRVVIVLILIASSLVFNYSNPYHYFRYRLGLETFDDFLTEGSFEGSSLVESLDTAEYLLQNTNENDFIYSWSEATQVYFYADRRSPIETIWPLYATAFGSYERILIPQTKYVILGHSIYVQVPEWLLNGLANDYHLDKVIGDYELYRRNKPGVP
jgi:hypothetical protein